MAYPLLTVDANPESSPEAPTPNRPATVPETGVWDAELGKWEVARKDEHGARDGERLLYRDDGTLFARARFVAGVQDGPFVVYHRDGKVAREGNYVSGKLDGTVTAYASESPDGERIRACCVPHRGGPPVRALPRGRVPARDLLRSRGARDPLRRPAVPRASRRPARAGAIRRIARRLGASQPASWIAPGARTAS